MVGNIRARVKNWLLGRDWRYAVQGFDYGFVLPVIARLPLRMAYLLAHWRGAFNARFHRDWAELSLGFPYVSVRCATAFKEMYPDASTDQIERWVVERYQTVAREEMEGWLTIHGRIDRIYMNVSPIQAALAKRTRERGLVILMSHFDNLFFGLVGVARCGVPVYLMTSDIVFDERVHPGLRRFFRVKYESYQKLINGGAFLPTGSHAKKTFYRVLGEGGVVVVVSDTPATDRADRGTWVQWMGKRRKMADSAVRMAIDTGSEMVGLRNRHAAPGTVTWEMSDLVDPKAFWHLGDAMAREAVYEPLYRFLEAGILKEPGRWWASHLLPDTPSTKPDID